MDMNLRALRKQAGRNQAELAELFNVSLSTWRRWESDPGNTIPYNTYLQIRDHLERAVQIRKTVEKENKPMNTPKKAKCVHVTVEEQAAYEKEHPYTVPIPEGLTEYFEPSQPVTDEQMFAWETRGVEPYDGFAIEMEDWENAWDEVNRAQAIANGEPVLDLPSIKRGRPDYDEETGQALIYPDETTIIADNDGVGEPEVLEAGLMVGDDVPDAFTEEEIQEMLNYGKK